MQFLLNTVDHKIHGTQLCATGITPELSLMGSNVATVPTDGQKPKKHIEKQQKQFLAGRLLMASW